MDYYKCREAFFNSFEGADVEIVADVLGLTLDQFESFYERDETDKLAIRFHVVFDEYWNAMSVEERYVVFGQHLGVF